MISAARTCRAVLVQLVLLCALSSCVPGPEWQLSHPEPRPGAPRLVVLQSDDNPLYQPITDSFVRQLAPHAAIDVTRLGRSEAAIERIVARRRPALVYALGTPAALFVRDHFPDVPLLFGMVVNHQRHPSLAHPLVMGVALEVPPLVEFTQFKMVMPKLTRVLAFYVPSQSGMLVEKARQALRTLQIELDAVAIAPEAGAAQRALGEHIGSAQAIWLMNDPVVMSRQNFAFLQQASLDHKRPLLCSLSDAFAESGALMSVSVELETLGFQAAVMAQKLLIDGRAPASLGVEAPIGARLTLNLDIAQVIGIEPPPEVLPFVSRIISARICPAQGCAKPSSPPQRP